MKRKIPDTEAYYIILELVEELAELDPPKRSLMGRLSKVLTDLLVEYESQLK